MFHYFFIIFGLLLFTINFFLRKFKILNHKIDFYDHKKIGRIGVPLSGGLYFFFSILFFLNFYQLNLNYLFYFVLFLILGLIIDSGYEIKPRIRLLLHIIIIGCFIFENNFLIANTGLKFLDYIIEIKFLNILFTVFCIVVFLNGLNFIDGVNCNSVGYSTFVLITISFVNIEFLDDNFESSIFITLISSFCIFYLFNLFNKSFLGESGNYIIGFFISILIINIINLNSQINPLLAVSLLWYPSFENLFSIIRKSFYQNINAFHADSLHLHTLIYKFLKIKKIKQANSYSGLLINLFLLPNFFISYFYYYHTKILILNILVYLILYIIIYILLNKKSIK